MQGLMLASQALYHLSHSTSLADIINDKKKSVQSKGRVWY
jgi:hypothetical protein